MNTLGLERRVNRCIVKEAAIGGEPRSIGEAAVNTGLYMTPFVGSGLTLKDAYKDFRKGRWLSGIGNTVLGIGTGLLDTVSVFGDAVGIGAFGHGAAAALRASKAVNAAKNATRAVVGAKNAARLASAGRKAYAAVRPALAGTARTIDSGMNWVRGTRAAKTMYNGANTALGYGRMARNWVTGTRPYQGFANGVRWLDQSSRIGHGIVGAGRIANSLLVRPYFSPGAGVMARGMTREMFGNGATGYLIGEATNTNGPDLYNMDTTWNPFTGELTSGQRTQDVWNKPQGWN